MPFADLRFSVVELCAFLGLVQCVYILVYMGLRAGQWSKAVLPFAYFFVLAVAFLGDFAFRFIGELPLYTPLLWMVWLASLPLSVLVIIQIMNHVKLPDRRDFLLLLLIPAFAALAFITASQHSACATRLACAPFLRWTLIYGMISACIAMLILWIRRVRLAQLLDDADYGRERYWLVLAMLIANSGLLLLALGAVSSAWDIVTVTLARDLIGLGFVYLAGTSLFRIYPRAVSLSSHAQEISPLTAEEYANARRIEHLLRHDKVYHEPGYGRVDMARELDIPETYLSRITNLYFGKSLPQLLNDYRVADAKYFLRNTDAPIRKIAEESGFNSLASFNRVFRDITGQSPGDYRSNPEKSHHHQSL